MANVLFFTGFEAGDVLEPFLAVVGTTSVQSSVKKTGSYAFRSYPTTTAVGYGQMVLPTATTGKMEAGNYGSADIYLSFQFRVATAPSANSEQIFRIQSIGGMGPSVRIQSDRKLAIYDETDSQLGSASSTALTLDTWYVIDFKMDYTGSTYDLRIAGVSEVSGSHGWSSTSMSNLFLGKYADSNNETVDMYYDDVVICSDEFITQPAVVTALTVDADGNYTAWSVGAGAGADYLQVDEIPYDSDTTYLKAPATLDVSSFQCTSLGVSGTVAAVKSNLTLKRSYSGDQVTLLIRSGSTDAFLGAAATLNAGYTSFEQMRQTDPATSSAWTSASVSAAEVGARWESTGDRGFWTACQLHVLNSGTTITGRPMIAYNFGG